jgi:erythronate-4-phosphate dehydrogenase
VGNIGSLVAQYAQSWGFRVICSDPPRERTEGLGAAEGFYPLTRLAAECDIITFHVPLTTGGRDATRHLVDRAFLSTLRPNTVILNSSRGEIMDPEALRETALGESPRARFIIDTWNNEPEIDRRVLSRALLATPHIAGYSVQGKAAATAMVINALERHFGLPSTGANGTGWYPDGAPRSTPRAITWDEMHRAMPSHFDIEAESAALKASPQLFEAMRNDYKYRIEFF